jgi:hypothetical protein
MNEFRLRKKELELQNQRLALGQAYEELEKIITKNKGANTSSFVRNNSNSTPYNVMH